MVVGLNVLHVSLTSASEEHPHDKDLQASHADHDSTFQQAEVEHSLLRTPDRAEVSVFSCAEVFLLAGKGGDLAGHAEDGLLDAAELLGSCAGFLREVCARLVFDLSCAWLDRIPSSRLPMQVLPRSQSQQAYR